MVVKHATQTAQPNNPSKDVSAVAWNENHTITPDLIANLLSDHNKTIHDALGIDHISLANVGSNSHVQIDLGLARSAAYRNRYTNISELYNTAYGYKQLASTQNGRTQYSPNDGDRLSMYFLASGGEIRLMISTLKGTNKPIWDLYINGVLDSSGYDDYAGFAIPVHRDITLTQAIQPGENIVEMRVNGKNASSSNYYIDCLGASISR